MVNTCNICQRSFDTIKGLNIHISSCTRKRCQLITRNNYIIDKNNVDNEQHTIETTDIINLEKINIVREEKHLPYLPTYTSISRQPNVPYGEINGTDFVKAIDDVYDEIVQWRKNLFKLPSGKASKTFINELTTWVEHFNKNSEFQCIALKVFMVLPNLILQKPSKTSKAKDHLKKVEERMTSWKEGKIYELVQECRIIQHRMMTSKRRNMEETARIFAKLMFQGKVTAALKLLKSDSENGVHNIDENIMKELEKKHPKPAPIQENTLLFGPINYLAPSYFDDIDETMIFKASRLTKGAGGPSHLDADQYCHILTSTKFKKENKELREQISLLAKKLATQILDPKTVEALVACRLIPLNKNPGVRPIGVGESLRRIIGKAIGWVLKNDIQETAGPLQAATGLHGGAEAAIHAMKTIFEKDDTEGVILVDASNAFNSLNRHAALHNIQILCPNFATILINTYRLPTRLIILGAKYILSTEGTTQGDNLSMSFYALGTSPLLDALKITCPNTSQVCLADDITGAGTLIGLRKWWDNVVNEGNKFGYYVNESKSWLILKDENNVETAKEIFKDSEIMITTEGKRHLGASLGSEDFHKIYCEEKVNEWCAENEKLSDYAKSQPHAAYTAFLHGEMHKFTYFMRTIPEMNIYIEKLDEVIKNRFLPSLLETFVTEQERKLFSMPTRFGGLGIPIMKESAEQQYSASKKITAPLVTIMLMQGLVSS